MPAEPAQTLKTTSNRHGNAGNQKVRSTVEISLCRCDPVMFDGFPHGLLGICTGGFRPHFGQWTPKMAVPKPVVRLPSDGEAELLDRFFAPSIALKAPNMGAGKISND